MPLRGANAARLKPPYAFASPAPIATCDQREIYQSLACISTPIVDKNDHYDLQSTSSQALDPSHSYRADHAALSQRRKRATTRGRPLQTAPLFIKTDTHISVTDQSQNSRKTVANQYEIAPPGLKTNIAASPDGPIASCLRYPSAPLAWFGGDGGGGVGTQLFLTCNQHKCYTLQTRHLLNDRG